MIMRRNAERRFVWSLVLGRRCQRLRSLTCAGLELNRPPSLPSWPSLLRPQAHAVPSRFTATWCLLPAAIEATSARLAIGVGVTRSVVLPSPSWPEGLGAAPSRRAAFARALQILRAITGPSAAQPVHQPQAWHVPEIVGVIGDERGVDGSGVRANEQIVGFGLLPLRFERRLESAEVPGRLAGPETAPTQISTRAT